ncbi:MAG: transposase [Rhodoferax sp.]|nr:transposase [Rhodoferax sp.]
MQVKTEVMRRLVLGHDRGGRCRYDPQAKAELIQECMKPGVSVARIAMQHGINANLLRAWITKVQSANAIAMQISPTEAALDTAQAFVPVMLETTVVPEQQANIPATAAQRHGNATTTLLHIQIRLANAVTVDLGETRVDELSQVLQVLNALPCSN